MEQSIMAPADGGQGAVTTDAPPADSGQGGRGEEASYAGFSTPEELAADYTAKTEELAGLQSQIQNLESLKGRQGGEIGNLRQQLATLNGQLEGMRSAMPQASTAGPSVDDVIAQYNSGEITEAEAFQKVATITAQTTENNLKGHVASEIERFKAEAAQAQYAEKFILENPGYKEAFESGKLDQWMSRNPDGSVTGGEFAWAQYQLQAKDAELAAFKQQAEESAKAAEQSGIDKGIKIEQGKTAAGNVLTGKGGQFAASNGNFNLNDPTQRRQAGIERLKQLRGG